MTTDMLFRHGNQTHTITRLRVVDEKPGEISVVEAFINGRDYVFFEAPHSAEPQDLIRLAIASWVEEAYDDRVEVRRFIEGREDV